MRNVVVVNRWIGITGLVLCLSLAVLALPGWWYLRHHWVPGDTIVYTRVLRPGLMIYVVRREDGVSVPPRYDYYLSGRFIDRSTLGGLMDRRAPFLSADNDLADVVVDGDDTLCVSVFGHVSGFQNHVMVDVDGVPQTIAIGLAARPADRPGGPRDDSPAARRSSATHAAPRTASTGPDGQPAKDREGGAPSVCRMLP
ncbi:hypothetical protein [Burkholderia glumae]|uniref:Uncharacterized protein n=2 Tax=Burkholderia glumae TaxID=337 RepID=A0AAP9XZU2_BURGL|nr:hypothetical protein [Burkholderia glumae]AJY66094.1 hypothetical protein KS03_1195 [Burkholderia glumae LMG 2196 = ATCC 33617]KHJ61828.1 hypothetical protein NCPPB3923_16725 [Burkholderia glumae]MCM2481587.1 hypothetical protein [Burkholderia glumae]MCM2491778.1 hypothetical protein [Burkholderia glumae]MCM2508273.1 hypothetical protein [Burkholderia glumae]